MNSSMTQPLSAQFSQWLAWSWHKNRPMTLLGIGSALFLLISLIGLIIDPRMVLNEPAWIKPLKFGISIILYAFTFLWLLTFIEGRDRLVRAVSWVTATGLFIELVTISLQALRGVRSHFNFVTPFDAFIFRLMGVAILLVWIAGFIATVLIVRQRLTSRPFAIALRFGLLITTIGAALGFIMTAPTSAQMDAIAATGNADTILGAHSVGVEDGTDGLPIVGWSVQGGDIRVSHFVGLHALQVLPIVGWLIIQQRRRLTEKQQAHLVWLAGLAYGSVTGITLWQALRGQSLMAPDTLTLAVTFGLFSLLTIAAIIIVQGTLHVHQRI